jgi:uncharacterized protein Veg
MNKLPFAIKEIRTSLEEMQGQPIKVRANMGRSKIFEREGIVHQIHPSLFVVETLEKRSRTARATYQFSDVLTRQVELSDPATGEMLFPWLLEEE